jgi:hypothetical protein
LGHQQPGAAGCLGDKAKFYPYGKTQAQVLAEQV